jgi:hypothetical protein
MKMKLPERRRFVRVESPLKIVVKCGDRIEELVTKNISPVGFRFEIATELDESEKLEIALSLPSAKAPIQLEAQVVWQSKISLEDKAPYDVGVDITSIEDKSKNIFLKYLCDLLYGSIYKERT